MFITFTLTFTVGDLMLPSLAFALVRWLYLHPYACDLASYDYMCTESVMNLPWLVQKTICCTKVSQQLRLTKGQPSITEMKIKTFFFV